MTNLNWGKNGNAKINSANQQIDLYWQDTNQSRYDGLVIVTNDTNWKNAVGMSIEEAEKLRDYLNSVIPKV